jgi:Cdc6-like AAA superfamily ATPase
MTEIIDYRAEMGKKLDILNKKVDELKTKVDALEGQKARQFYQHLEKFNTQQEEARTKLQDLDKIKSEAQAEAKRYLEKTFQNLKESLEIRLAPFIENE